MISITLVYVGRYIKSTGKRTEVLSVDKHVKIAIDQIAQFLETKYKIKLPFILLIRGMHSARAVEEKIELKDYEEIRIIPFLSGG
jgi:molybdopterin converting factor small subunit